MKCVRSYVAWLFALTILTACDQNRQDISDPSYNPYILKPGKYISTTGKELSLDAMVNSRYIPIKGQDFKIAKPKFIPIKTNFWHESAPAYVQTAGQTNKMDAARIPSAIPFKCERVDSPLPKWIPAQPGHSSASGIPFYFLDEEQGLISSGVQDILEDRQGRIWIATNEGLNVWDGVGLSHYSLNEGLCGTNVNQLLQDSSGRIWIGTRDGGVCIWDEKGFVHPVTEKGLIGTDINRLMQDREGRIWLASNASGLSVWSEPDPENSASIEDPGELGGWITHYTTEEGLSSNRVMDILEDKEGKIWISTENGLNVWNPDQVGKAGAFIRYSSQDGLNSDFTFGLKEDQQGNIWIGAVNGLNVWDGNGFKQFTRSDGLSGDRVREFAMDKEGKVWMSDGDDLSVWDPANQGFLHFAEDDGFRFNRVWALLADHTGNIWIGTQAHGLMVLDHDITPIFDKALSDQLIPSRVHSLVEDKDDNVWIGYSGNSTNSAGFLRWQGNGFLFYLGADYHSGAYYHDEMGNTWLYSNKGLIKWNGTGQGTYYDTGEQPLLNRTRKLVEDLYGNMWFGNEQGFGVLDNNGYHFYEISADLSDNQVNTMLRDRENKIWIGTRNGILVVDPSPEGGVATIVQYTNEEGLFGNEVLALMQDPAEKIWVGTNRGLSIWDGNGFRQYNGEQGLIGNRIFCLSQDPSGVVWMGTDNGFSRLQPIPEEGSNFSKGYYQIDGSRDHSIYSILVDQQQRLWLGSNKGFEIMSISNFKSDTSRPIVHFRAFQPFFDAIDWRQVLTNKHHGGNLSIGEVELRANAIEFDSIFPQSNLPFEPSFPHGINQLTLSWTGIHWPEPLELQYSYLLEGRDRAWSPLIREHKITYRDLRPGAYTFKIRAVTNNGRWSNTASFFFSIRPPWWQTVWAYLFYFLCFLTGLYSLFRYLLNRRMKLAAIAQELELNTYRTNLYANITHEFRTPITIILGMVRQINANPEKWYHEGLEMIHRNGRQLLQLVNQMLDLGKLDKGKLLLKPKRVELVSYLGYLIQAFSSHAASKNIQLHFLKELDELELDFDPDQLSKIVSNLLSNAVKYTPEGGNIYLSVRHSTTSLQPASPLGTVEISIKDTGQGIPEKELPHIFDRFYRGENSTSGSVSGSGIGLSLVRELVTLMKGNIQVQSKLKEGTTFTVCLPVSRSASTVREAMPIPEEFREVITPLGISPLVPTEPKGKLTPSSMATVLLIEDNQDVLHYLASCLEAEYHLEYATNGREGVNRAIELAPDLIVSDIMMPEMDGYEVAARLKHDERTSHIPILLLTAKADIDSKIKGLEQGADAYLSKPFEPRELKVRLKKLIQLRQKLQHRYSSLGNTGPSEDPLIQKQDTFMSKFRKVIEDRIEDKDFGIVQLSRVMKISRTQLHNKVKALTGKSTSQAIRSIRLQKAKELLLSSDLNVSEVADSVGFKNATYFSSCFSEEFGMPPSELKNQ